MRYLKLITEILTSEHRKAGEARFANFVSRYIYSQPPLLTINYLAYIIISTNIKQVIKRKNNTKITNDFGKFLNFTEFFCANGRE